MIRIGLVFAVFLILLIVPAAQAAKIEYTGESGRDPFSSPFEQKRVVESAEANEKKLQTLVVQGIVASSSNPRAIVNGKIYRVGNELLPGVKVTRIEKEGVFVLSGEKETLLTRPIQPIKGKTAK